MTNRLDDDVVRRARDACNAAHAGQQRDDGADYATHPHAVACILGERGLGDMATLAAAYLHDVLEDTSVTEEKLVGDFGAEIVGLVKEVTNIGAPGRSFAQKQAALLEHARRMSPRAELIKLADRLHNLSGMVAWPDWKQKRYAQATTELLEALRPWPDDGLAESVRQAVLGALERLEAE
jgi:GTP pyrophosphokinase